ncbi:hypothetical protein [Neptunomonas antarctica]|uniref:hypothetical protein n=1 Tax=Neptunomonas antarctica TaxID=619304 RepID=UPI0012E0D9B5|nr:hypothetical protein [Neptunomonas antarctica]
MREPFAIDIEFRCLCVGQRVWANFHCHGECLGCGIHRVAGDFKCSHFVEGFYGRATFAGDVVRSFWCYIHAGLTVFHVPLNGSSGT